jgi:hypothetical protein
MVEPTHTGQGDKAHGIPPFSQKEESAPSICLFSLFLLGIGTHSSLPINMVPSYKYGPFPLNDRINNDKKQIQTHQWLITIAA